MVEEQENSIIEKLKQRGLTCNKLKELEEKQMKDAEEFRKVGFSEIANSEELTAGKIRDLRKKVCLLR